MTGQEKENLVELDENALLVLNKRYLRKDDEGNVAEMPDDLF